MIVAVFVLGYLAIALEHNIGINKAASALAIGVICWTIYILQLDQFLPLSAIPEWFAHEAAGGDVKTGYAVEHLHLRQTGEIASILFFLTGAMTIVELMDANESFSVVTNRIGGGSRRRLMIIVGVLTFFLSAVLDNLTTTIVMVSLLRKVLSDREDRLLFVGLVVIAANAGGAWTVIGDVTTTMLWIKHKIDTLTVMKQLVIGSLVCLIVPLIGLSRKVTGDLPMRAIDSRPAEIPRWRQGLFLALGIVALLSVPIFKMLTHLPPYMGMLLSLSVLWIVSEVLGRHLPEETRTSTGVLAALQRVDLSSILFFLGILLAVGALGTAGYLSSTAAWLDRVLPNREVVAVVIGMLSAVVDNVPLVAAGIEMYDMPMNDNFWMLLAYCAGTGGSCLIIGSAAGVAAMGMEKIPFGWYLRKIGPWALAGYLCGAAVTIALLRVM